MMILLSVIRDCVMDIEPVSNKQSFTGKIIIKNPISKTQNYLFNLHRPALEQKIKDMPFDLFVEQSKSRKTITLSTNVDGASSFFVRKNKQNFVEVADYVIEDSKKKSVLYQRMLKVNEMFEYNKSILINIMTGNFEQVRAAEKQLAKVGVEDFEAYKMLPHVKFNTSFDVAKIFMKNGFKYRVYKMFSRKTPEEKAFLKMKKAYVKELKANHQEVKTVVINMPTNY